MDKIKRLSDDPDLMAETLLNYETDDPELRSLLLSAAVYIRGKDDESEEVEG